MHVLINRKLIFHHSLSDEAFDDKMCIRRNENMTHHKEMFNKGEIFHV